MTGLAAPWSDKILNIAWDRVRGVVPEKWLPTRAGRSAKKFEELGCGAFGCVMPTSDPEVVLKLTSDKSEAQFARIATEFDWVPGIVTYHKVVQVEGATYRRRPIYLLWRQVAEDVGFLQRSGVAWGNPGNDYDQRMANAAARYIQDLKYAGVVAHDKLSRAMKKAETPDERAKLLDRTWGEYLSAFDRYLDAMREGRTHWMGDNRGLVGVGVQCVLANNLMGELLNNPVGYAIGEGAQFYLEEQQILLADLHLGNIGKDADGTAIITDPGLAVQVGTLNYPPPDIEVI
jgi:hypothetical protein